MRLYIQRLFISLFLLGIILSSYACQPGVSSLNQSSNVAPNLSESEEDADPAEIALGERLFRETRFAQFFAAHNTSINAPLVSGDPVMDVTPTLGSPLLGPYKGKSMNCAACHLVDEQLNVEGGGMRTYSDFARRSPIPARLEDDHTMTPRNSPPLVNSTLPRNTAMFLHFDGEFTTIEDLVKGTFVGRNFGWLATERSAALRNLARVIREDDGQGDLASNYANLPYKKVLAGIDPSIPEEYRIPPAFRINVDASSDELVFHAVAKLVSAYVDGLVFSQDNKGQFNASPFDEFLRKNHLPRVPEDGETELDFSRRLLAEVNALQNPYFISGRDGSFSFHNQDFRFGTRELEGLKIFFEESSQIAAPPRSQGVGNCIACHAAPNFTDFKFHNTGATQEEYDAIHGAGSFWALPIPSLAARNASPELYLAPSPSNPAGTGRFISAPSLARPGYTDLGVWNVYGNSDHPLAQETLQNILCEMNAGRVADCEVGTLLPLTIGLFKTPGLRDLGHAAPYMHNGELDTIEEVIRHYINFSQMARTGLVRNADPEMSNIHLTEEDIAPLTAFLKSLNEDYN